MGIINHAQDALSDYLRGRTIRKFVQEEAERQSRKEDGLEDLLSGLGSSEDDKVREEMVKNGLMKGSDHLITVTESDLVRRVLYDIGEDDPEGLLESMGWTAPSPDVVEMQRRESATRMEKVESLSPLVHAMAKASAFPYIKEMEWDEEDFDDVVEFGAHSTLSIIAQLVEMGILIPAAAFVHTAYVSGSEEEADGE